MSRSSWLALESVHTASEVAPAEAIEASTSPKGAEP
jgi:hypothetical protein